MATRTIVTSQPDVACDVCARRLLRGEHPDVFIADGRRRVVCELCAPRAVHEGWLRETDGQSLSLPALGPRRGRSLFGRLRQVGRPAPASGELPAAAGAYSGEQAAVAAPEPEPYDFLDGGYGAGASAPVPAAPRAQAEQTAAQTGPPAGSQEQPQGEDLGADAGAGAPVPGAFASDLEQAIAVFNASEHARRGAGVARSLGAPEVNVRTAEHASSVVVIVLAWELCWYRYQVDLDELPPEARLVAEGTEVGELAHEDRVVNALAGDSGALVLAGV